MIIMVGVPGSGKTFFAEKFADTFRAPYVSREKIAAHFQEDNEAIDAIASDQIDELLKTQQSIVVDGFADTRTARSELSRKSLAAGYDTLLVWVQTDPATAKSRTLKLNKNGASRALTPEEYDHLARRFSAPTAIEKPVVLSGKHTYATQAKVILKKLTEPRASISRHTAAPVRPDLEKPGRRSITIR
jgi:predicted kinase